MFFPSTSLTHQTCPLRSAIILSIQSDMSEILPLYEAVQVLQVLESLETANRLEGRKFLSGTGLNALAEAWLDVTIEADALRAVLIAAGLELNVKSNGYPVEALRAQVAPGSLLREIAERARSGEGYNRWLVQREQAALAKGQDGGG